MGVAFTSSVVKFGLGGTIRDLLVTDAAAATAVCLPLAETEDTVIHDTSNNRNHGTLSGTGTVRGVELEVPEGVLGMTFAGTSHVEVPDDGPDTNRGMSMAGGDMDVCCLIQTSTNDATLRCIACKQETDSSGNGWHLGYQNAAIEFYLEVAGSVIFNFQRGSIADGALHDVRALYDRNANEAWIEIDGAMSGAKVTGIAAVDPAYQAVAFRAGKFIDGSGGFIGTLAYVMCGREGDNGLGPRMHAARSWTTITDVRQSAPLTVEGGIAGNQIWDQVSAGIVFTCNLDNSARNSVSLEGAYSLGHANQRAGFTPGMPVKWEVTYGGTTREIFRGRMVDCDPMAGSNRPRLALMTAHSWLAEAAANSYVGDAPAQVSQFSDTVLGVVIDQATYPPPALDIGTGYVTFPYALDSGQAERESLLSQFGKICGSDFSYLYERQGGKTLTWRTKVARQVSATLAATLTNTMTDLKTIGGKAQVRNSIGGTIFPPTVDGSPTVLWSLLCDTNNQHAIQPGSELTFDCPYTDSGDRPSRVGGTGIITPAASSDYTANTLSTGAGADLTSTLTVEPTLGANVMRLRVTNTGAGVAFITKLQVRGNRIIRDQKSELVARSDASIREHGEKSQTIQSPYLGSVVAAAGVLNGILEAYKTPTTRATEVTFLANNSSGEMAMALDQDVGDRVGIVETVSGLTAGDGMMINSRKIQQVGDVLTVTWGLAPAWPASLMLAYTVGALSDIHDFNGGDLELVFGGDYTFTFNRTGDQIELIGAGGGGGGGNGRADSTHNPGGGGGGSGAVQTAGITVTVSTMSYTGKVGAKGAGASSGAGGTGGTTEFRIPASTVYLELPGGVGGGAGAGDTGGAGGTGAAAGTGAGNVAGVTGGVGGNTGGGGGSGTNNTSGAGSGAGGGASGANGDVGGNGKDQSGGAAAGAGNAGVDATGGGAMGGLLGSGSPGGGGSAGGGAFICGDYRAAGGGGSAGATSSTGHGGDGGGGALRIRKL
jgi:hypothetical protein